MLSLTEKKSLFEQLIELVQREYDTALAAQKATQEGATHEEARPENDKDTRALEQTYLARGQAERVASLEADLNQLRAFSVRVYSEESALGLGALVRTEDDEGRTQWYLLAPSGAGQVVQCRLGTVKVVTSRSPLGRALIGSRCDDDVELRTPTGKRVLSVVSIC